MKIAVDVQSDIEHRYQKILCFRKGFFDIIVDFVLVLGFFLV